MNEKKGKTLKTSKKGIAFSSFIRAAIGLAYVPLNKVDLAFGILKKMALELKGKKIKAFGQNFLKYYEKVWLGKNYSRESWNMHMHKGISSNNVSEGYNSKINGTKELGIHPNPYILADFIKKQLALAEANTECSDVNAKHSRPQEAKFKRLRKFKDTIVKNMDQLHGDWRTYIIAIGEATMEMDLRISQTSDDFNSEEKDEVDLHGPISPLKVNVENDESLTGDALRQARAKLANKKPTSDESLNLSYYNDTVQQPDKEKTIHEQSKTKKKRSHHVKELTLEDGKVHVQPRLNKINFMLSPSQPNTLGDGNCFLYAILDQLR